MATIATRLSIDVLRSARVRRETYVGEWLPEPLVSDPSADPARHAEMADSLSLAFLVMLETLSPEQRAAFLLHDVFGYGYGEVAEIVGKSEANARQLAARARAARRGGAAALRGLPRAARRAGAALLRRRPGRRRGRRCESCSPRTWCSTATAAARCPRSAARSTARGAWRGRSAAWFRTARGSPDSRFRMVDVNGQPGALSTDGDGNVINVMALDIADGRIQGIQSIVNPDKLAPPGPDGQLGGDVKGSDPLTKSQNV